MGDKLYSTCSTQDRLSTSLTRFERGGDLALCRKNRNLTGCRAAGPASRCISTCTTLACHPIAERRPHAHSIPTIPMTSNWIEWVDPETFFVFLDNGHASGYQDRAPNLGFRSRHARATISRIRACSWIQSQHRRSTEKTNPSKLVRRLRGIEINLVPDTWPRKRLIHVDICCHIFNRRRSSSAWPPVLRQIKRHWPAATPFAFATSPPPTKDAPP